MCLQYVLEYCAESPFDTGCDFLVPTFERRIGEVTELAIHVAVDTPVAIRILPAGCSCGEACRAGVAVLDTMFSSSNALGVVRVSLVGDLPGDYSICRAPYGSLEPAQFTTLVASLAMLPTGCLFEGYDSPCAAKQCVDAETSEECQLLVAEYCATHPEDEGCAQFVPFFTRSARVLETIELHSTGIHKVEDLQVVQAACGCGSTVGCAEAAVELYLLTLDAETATMTVQLQALTAGQFKLCAADVLLASLAVTDTRSCAFEVGEPNPCTVKKICDDVSSDACQQFIAEFCETFSSDPGCQYLMPRFERRVHEETTLSLHAAAMPSVSVVPVACGCGGGCDSAVAVRSVDRKHAVGVLEVTLFADSVGEYIVCTRGAAVAGLTVVSQDGCAFAYSDSPCSATACADEDSEECQLLTASYCLAHPEDEACAYYVPRFARVVNVQTSQGS
jgi:hypothetical protein